MSKKSFILHDESVNSKGFRMLTAGANLTEFRKNPVMLLMHDDYNMPIGRWENIRVEGTKILADPVFDEKDPKAIEVMGKVNRGFIRMASIGAWQPEEMSENPMLKLPGQLLPTVIKWTVREASIVTIGSNHNAIVFYDRETGKHIKLGDIVSVPVRKGETDSKVHTNSKEHQEVIDFTNMSWDEIDKSGKLGLFKTKYSSLYESKFAEKFGHKPSKL